MTWGTRGDRLWHVLTTMRLATREGHGSHYVIAKTATEAAEKARVNDLRLFRDAEHLGAEVTDYQPMGYRP